MTAVTKQEQTCLIQTDAREKLMCMPPSPPLKIDIFFKGSICSILKWLIWNFYTPSEYSLDRSLGFSSDISEVIPTNFSNSCTKDQTIFFPLHSWDSLKLASITDSFLTMMFYS